MTTNASSNGKLTRKDFVSDQEVRWCPGCGDYAILKAVQSVMPEIDVPRENIVFVSGIGCSSRFPYYMNTYGMHTIHGRAPAIATGLKLARPDLSVWVVTGDGDGLSIGGNHLLHALRRNIDINILLFNNRIYGLTKGQYSPTSELGKINKSAPMGSIDRPVNPLAFALGASATFVARCVDVEVKVLQSVLQRAAAHKGGAFIEILQNCNVFNDGAFVPITDRAVRDDRQLRLEHGKPLLFGKDKSRGIRVRPDLTPEVVEVGDGPGQVPVSEIAVHDERGSAAYAFMLAQMDYPEFPAPMGVLHAVDAPAYEQLSAAQIAAAKQKNGAGDLKSLLHAGTTWDVH
ncbi:MAG: 2-oxoacid:ferredoxin oxidoreductase subunit beta [Deltaproteobacteria bacterium]|nr:MAG: 2-oxoacid:ferredoxin oxidoreductase subunit beta [Deltaproteobacteria bacterium]